MIIRAPCRIIPCTFLDPKLHQRCYCYAMTLPHIEPLRERRPVGVRMSQALNTLGKIIQANDAHDLVFFLGFLSVDDIDSNPRLRTRPDVDEEYRHRERTQTADAGLEQVRELPGLDGEWKRLADSRRTAAFPLSLRSPALEVPKRASLLQCSCRPPPRMRLRDLWSTTPSRWRHRTAPHLLVSETES